MEPVEITYEEIIQQLGNESASKDIRIATLSLENQKLRQRIEESEAQLRSANHPAFPAPEASAEDD